jgi:hypothetical protein
MFTGDGPRLLWQFLLFVSYLLISGMGEWTGKGLKCVSSEQYRYSLGKN